MHSASEYNMQRHGTSRCSMRRRLYQGTKEGRMERMDSLMY